MSVEGIAARLQRPEAPLLCLLPHAAAAAQLKRAFAGIRRLPLLLPLDQLLAAAQRLPLDAQLPQLAAVLPPAPPPAVHVLPWKMLAGLRDACGVDNPTARLELAKKLAALFAEADAHLPLAAGENPFAALRTHEGEAAAAMWEVFGEEALTVQPLLQELAAVLPPFLAVCDDSTTPVQRAFYARCAAEVVELAPPPAEAAWRDAFVRTGAMPPQCAHHACEGAGETLSDTAQLALRALQEFAARHGEQEGGIGVVVYDRLLARRLRAVAEAAGILIADRGGWRAETLSYGAALARGAALLLDAFSLSAVQQSLQAPFYARYAALPRAAQDWRDWLGEAMTLPPDADGLAEACAQHERARALLPLLRAQAKARAAAAGQLRPPAQWLDWLYEATAHLCAAWQDDRLAQQLRAQLAQRAAEGVALKADEFLLWLRDALAEEYVSEDEISSVVEFVPPGSRRNFAAVLLLGYSGSLLSEAQGWLGERERAALRLPPPAQRTARERADFCHFLAGEMPLAAVWCAADAAGAPQQAHPFWQLFAAHCKAHGCLRQIARPPAEDAAAGVPPPRRAAEWRQVRLPRKLNLSAAEMAMRCPYLFYGTHGLGLCDVPLPALDEVSPMLAGQLMHKALAQFVEQSAEMTEAAELQACWREVAAQTLQGSRPGLGLLRQYWHENGDSLVTWELARREAGWRTTQREYPVRAALPLPDGAELILSGRIDRLDENAAGERAVVDYKGGGKPRRDALTFGELPQLPLYAFLLEMQGGAAASEQLLCRPLHHRSGDWQLSGDASPRHVAARWRRVLREAAGGAALPANGALTGACAGCPAEGLCRREHWQT